MTKLERAIQIYMGKMQYEGLKNEVLSPHSLLVQNTFRAGIEWIIQESEKLPWFMQNQYKKLVLEEMKQICELDEND